MNCLDSTFLIDFLDTERERHDVAREWMAAHQEEPLYAPTFVLWEVLRGAARLDGTDGVEELRTELEWLTPLPLSSTAVVEAALIEAECREEGQEINVADYAIAGTAREAGATLLTADPDFEHVNDLDVRRYA